MGRIVDTFRLKDVSKLGKLLEIPSGSMRSEDLSDAFAVAECLVANAAKALRLRYEFLLNEGFEFALPEIAFVETQPVVESQLDGVPPILSIWKRNLSSVFFNQSLKQSNDPDSRFKGFQFFSSYGEDAFWSLHWNPERDPVVDGKQFVDLGASPSVDELLGFARPCNAFSPRVLNDPPVNLVSWLERFVQRGTLKIHDSAEFIDCFGSLINADYVRTFIQKFTAIPFDFWSENNFSLG